MERRSEQLTTMVSNSLTVRWNAHYAALLEMLKDSRREGWYSDATICCNGNFYSIHKFVLAACSTYFEDMFSMVREGKPMIIMTDIKNSTLEALLTYMYDGEANILQEELAGVMETAKAWKIRGLCNTTPVQEQRPQRKNQSSPLQNDILPCLDQLCEHSDERINLNCDLQNANYIQSRENTALSSLPAAEDVFPSRNRDEVILGSSIPSIVPGSAVTLRASDKSNGSSSVQQGESNATQLGAFRQNFEVNANHDDLTGHTMAVELKAECEDITLCSSTFLAEEMFTGFSHEEITECMEYSACVEENSTQIESALTPMQPRDFQPEINKAKKVTEMGTKNDVAGNTSEISENVSAKKRRNIRLPKRFYTPDILEGKRSLRRNSRNKRTHTSDENIRKEMEPPKRKIGRPRKHPLPQTVQESVSDHTVPLQSNHNENRYDTGVLQNVKNLPSNLPSEVNKFDQVTSISNEHIQSGYSEITPGTLDQVQADSINKALRSGKCLSASKRRIKLLRQFRKNVSTQNDSISEENIMCFKSTNPKYKCHTRKRLSKAKRWSRTKQRTSLKNKVSRSGMSSYKGINFEKSMKKQVIESLSSLKNLTVNVEKLDQAGISNI